MGIRQKTKKTDVVGMLLNVNVRAAKVHANHEITSIALLISQLKSEFQTKADDELRDE